MLSTLKSMLLMVGWSIIVETRPMIWHSWESRLLFLNLNGCSLRSSLYTETPSLVFYLQSCPTPHTLLTRINHRLLITGINRYGFIYWVKQDTSTEGIINIFTCLKFLRNLQPNQIFEVEKIRRTRSLK